MQLREQPTAAAVLPSFVADYRLTDVCWRCCSCLVADCGDETSSMAFKSIGSNTGCSVLIDDQVQLHPFYQRHH